MKFIASCLLALSAVNQKTLAFTFSKSPLSTHQSSSSKVPVRFNAASIDSETENGSSDANGSSDYDLLGLPARPGRPLKVAIAGGGVGGLTAAYYMLKKVSCRNFCEKLFHVPS